MKKTQQSTFSSPWWMTLYIVLQCTWGFLQSALGLCLFLIHLKEPHDFYHGSIRTKWATFNGISLGFFIFTPNEDSPNLSKRTSQGRDKIKDTCERISVHEYGHTYQSLILGPLYLFTVGITSLIWSRSTYYQTKRKKDGLTYSSLWTEKWANNLGEKILNKPSISH
ncbi:hypothetical protein [Alkalibacterium olivapovliticus]|uniref:Uncharacterized protein n=1 Tax=Alkalibacterium olivapovliticus TaxID=99907 RepID=A0A2T0WA10_9LACT|nr:hypothetical protein [Alkalibacterium olivapovliticus]PRY83466.1 hypothetical protein CLV38_10472 [Alkalibacterium olivapovliticus]